MVQVGLVGGVVGGIVGVAGGIFGTWTSIGSTSHGEQWKFIIKVSIWVWIAIAGFLALLFFLPKPWGWIAWIVYRPMLTFFIIYTNRISYTLRAQYVE